MNLVPSLPPHLARFVREQFDGGYFRDENELVQTALSLPVENLHADEAYRTWLKQENDRGLANRIGIYLRQTRFVDMLGGVEKFASHFTRTAR